MSEDNYKTGSVKWYNHDKGFGFITPDNGRDVFVHAKQLEKSGIMSGLNEGAAVRFVTETGPKGLFATKISVVKAGVNA